MQIRDKIVTVVNRVVDADGKRVPYQAYFDGTVITIQDSEPVTAGAARVIVHNSMYRIDPDTNYGLYRLGVKEWGMPVEDVSDAEVHSRNELIDREQLPPHRQFGAIDSKTGKRYQQFVKKQPIRRHDPIAISSPGARDDGVFPGGFGDSA